MSSCSPVERAVASLTRALYGTDLPKQFAVLAGDRSLLQTTIARATTLTSAERISVVVTAHHEAIAREQLAPYPAVELVVQPRNLDTAPGMLLPLVRLVTRSVAENVVFMPLDHHITNTEPVMRALRCAMTSGLSDRLTLIGVAPTGPEIHYGWIVRGKRFERTGASSQLATASHGPEGPHLAGTGAVAASSSSSSSLGSSGSAPPLRFGRCGSPDTREGGTERIENQFLLRDMKQRPSTSELSARSSQWLSAWPPFYVSCSCP